jgi:hypothetical protein
MPTLRNLGRAVVTLFVALAIVVSPTLGWDSTKWNPTHPTHSYLTEWAIDQVKGEFPEAEAYRRQLLEGANEELHERPVKGTKYGIELDARRSEHKGTNEGCDDIAGWWRDCVDAYRAGQKEKAFFLLGIILHMVEDMGVPAHANKIVHQGDPVQFDNFEFMALSNWKPNYAEINRVDPSYAEPWKYYDFSRDWTHTDAPDYKSRDQFSKIWKLAKPAEKSLLSNRQGRTCHVVLWTLKSASKALGSK